jgi:hypothetical protein
VTNLKTTFKRKSFKKISKEEKNKPRMTYTQEACHEGLFEEQRINFKTMMKSMEEESKEIPKLKSGR